MINGTFIFLSIVVLAICALGILIAYFSDGKKNKHTHKHA